ncbi:hypothetical protein Tco_0562519 [Tanacetum coccineum]
MFCSNIREELKEEILEIVPFAVGKLPVRYLGVPLVTRRLRVKDCKSLVEKVKGKVGDWKNKFLSYAGRMQLIAYVPSTMQTYWASVFLLRKITIKEIDSCAGFHNDAIVASMVRDGEIKMPEDWIA